MENSNPRLQNNIAKMEKQLQNFGEILQKFGLDLIQSIGEMKHNLSVLSDKIEKIEHELIELKGLKNQLQESSKLREEILVKSNRIEKQVKLLNSKVDQYYQVNFPSANDLRTSTTPRSQFSQTGFNNSPKNPAQIIQKFYEQISSAGDYSTLVQILKDLREQIYVSTGGHKILLEIRGYEKNLEKTHNNTNLDNIKADLKDKLKKWKKEIK
ncbi:hypothetical protein [Candidatus Harpocratesius sp.]